MAGPWEEDVIEALVDALDTIKEGTSGGRTYYHTPHVGRFDRLGPWLLNDDRPEFIGLAPVEIEIAEIANQQVQEGLLLEFQLSAKHEESDIPYEEETPLRWTRQNQLFHDFKTKILEIVLQGGLEGLIHNIDFRRVIFVADETYVSRWANVIGQIMPHQIIGELGDV